MTSGTPKNAGLMVGLYAVTVLLMAITPLAPDKAREEPKPKVMPTQQKVAEKEKATPSEVEKARAMLLRKFPTLSSRGGYSASGPKARKVFDQESNWGVGPTTEALWNHNVKQGIKPRKTIYTTYHKMFNGRFCATGVQYRHYDGYRVASNRLPQGSRVLLRYKNKVSWKYCVVVIADTGGLPLDGKGGAIQVDCSDRVAKDLGFYYAGNRYGEAIVLPDRSIAERASGRP